MAKNKIVVMTEANAETLLTNGSVTIGTETYTLGETIPCIPEKPLYRHNLEISMLDTSSNTRAVWIAIINHSDQAMNALDVYNELITTNQYWAYDQLYSQAIFFNGSGGDFIELGQNTTGTMADVLTVTADNIERI